jgi:hypothetical protein
MSALERAASEASSARAARLGERTDDVIADANLGNVRTHSSHDPRHLVTEHRRRRNEVGVGGEQEVGMT